MWELSYRADPLARQIADRHYNRQSVGSAQFVPPGRCLVYVKHAWAGAWVCSAFRNESPALSSDLIREAVAATAWRWPEIPDGGMVTFVDASKVRHKRDPGRCYLRAGFKRVGMTAGGLIALLPGAMPEPAEPVGAQQGLVR